MLMMMRTKMPTYVRKAMTDLLTSYWYRLSGIYGIYRCEEFGDRGCRLKVVIAMSP